MTPDREREIVDAYLRHGSVKDAAYVAMASKSTVRRVTKRAGVLKARGRPWSKVPRDKTWLRSIIASAGGKTEAARLLGCHPNTIRNRLVADDGKAAAQ